MSEVDVLGVAIYAYQRTDPTDVLANAICQMAGISKPSLYRAIGNEDGLTLAALDRYAAQVLGELFVVLQRNEPIGPTIDALIDIAVNDPRLETGCLFYKMRAGKHRLGPKTQERVEQIDLAVAEAFEAYLEGQQQLGAWDGKHSIPFVARYIKEQIGLTLTQRATEKDISQLRVALSLALSAVKGA